MFSSPNDRDIKARLSQAIAVCEAGLLEPDNDVDLKFLFKHLADQGYNTLKKDQEIWIAELKEKRANNP